MHINKILILLAIILCFNAKAQQKKVDSLVVELKNMHEDTLKAIKLNELIRIYINTGKYDSAKKYINDAFKLSEMLGFEKGTAKTYSNQGMIFLMQGDFNSALSNYKDGLSISQKINDRKGIASGFNNSGLVYMYLGNYNKALDCFYKGLVMREELNDKPGMGLGLLNIGLIYLNQGNAQKARQFFTKSLNIHVELGDKKYEATNLNNIGITYMITEDTATALEYYLKASVMYESIGDRRGLAMTYANIGLIYSEQGKLNEGLDNLVKSMAIYKETDDIQGVGVSYLNIGRIFIKQKKLVDAEEYFNLGLELFRSNGYKLGMKDAYTALSELYEKKGDYAQALKYRKLFSDIKDTLLNETSSKQIAEMNTKYESEKKEKDIELLTKDKELQIVEIGRQKLIRNGFVGGMAIALLLAFVLFNRFYVTCRQKKIIDYQNSQIVESINYSKKIQDSLLPSIESMQKVLPSLFVFYEPKDIVSGDFYFFKEFKNYILLSCVDCTGHGVPGGFMSTLGSLLLDKIANDESLKPSEILTKLNDEIIRILHQQSGGELQDGMDLSVCLIDRNNHQIEFSGARNGIIIVSNNEAKRYKASPLPVGGNYMKKGIPVERNFQTQTIALTANDWVYMYTDGFVEQVGGSEGIPMNYEQFEKQLIALTKVPTAEEKIKVLHIGIDKWRGEQIRTDDVLVMGFKVV